jgi:hypothetical protein
MARGAASPLVRTAATATDASRRNIRAALGMLFIAALPLLTTGCVGFALAQNPECRIAEGWGECDRRVSYVKSHTYLDAHIRAAVLNGQVVVGMPADAVLATWGEPRIRNISSNGEEWVYGYIGDRKRLHRTRRVVLHGGRVTSWNVYDA